MPAEVQLPAATVVSFLLVLTRVASVFVFLPLPGAQAGPGIARIVLSLGCALALFSRWPDLRGVEASNSQFVQWILSEAALGLAVGIAVSYVAEAFVLGAQVLSTQAGYGYASTIDPSTEADSSSLQVLAQLTAGMLFFTLGFDRQIIYAFARSLETYPPGAYALSRSMVEGLTQLGATVFTLGLRVALPVMGLLMMVDIALALLGRVAQQLQLISLAFPLKMMLSLALLSWILVLFPNLYENYGAASLSTVHRLLLP